MASAFQRRHMEATAEALRDGYAHARTYADAMRRGDREYRQGLEMMVEEMAYALARMFAESNPAFDSDRFMRACFPDARRYEEGSA